MRPLAANGLRETYLRAQLEVVGGVITVTADERQDSSLVSVFATANALLIRPVGASAVAAGELVSVLPLDHCQYAIFNRP